MASSATATKVITATITALSSSGLPAASATQAPSQSILDPNHQSPAQYSASNPIVLFIIQATIIISISFLLSLILKKLRQPRVISEVIGGIILGPTAFGRIPNFTTTIFPAASIPNLNLVANLGLVLFLFIVGLEIDVSMMRRNWRAAAGVGVVGLVVPFAFGAAVAKGLYGRFVDQDAVSLGHFLLFICVAFGITAFPVLCRILTELKLLQNPVGTMTLAAGVANDVLGWVLLALAVTLVNAGSGVIAVYVLLAVLGWALCLIFVIRPVFLMVVRRSGSFETGEPTQGIMCIVLLLTFMSAWLTQVLGVHAIFGGFLVGVIMPHQHGFANALTTKIEDLVSVFFLPLYFALSGLQTDLGVLNNGSIWGWFACVLVTAELSKFLPCFGISLLMGMDWRESGAVGSLMACKGLVELIVLNIGLNAKILNQEVFAQFVLMALLTTFMTTPLTLTFYPVSYQLRKAAMLHKAPPDTPDDKQPRGKDSWRSRFLVVLNRLDHLPSMMAFVKLLQPPLRYHGNSEELVTRLKSKEDEAAGITPTESAFLHSGIRIDALRLLELSARTSDVMKANETEETARVDPLTNIFRTFANLNGVNVSTSLSIVPSEAFSTEIAGVAAAKESEMVIIPWSAGTPVPTGQDAGSSRNPLEKLFGGEVAWETSPQYAALVRSIFAESTCDVALFVEGGGAVASSTIGSAPWTGEQHIFFAFHGGPDDRASLDFVIQLCRHPGISATVVRVIRVAEATGEDNVELLKLTTAEKGDAKAVLSTLTVHGGSTKIDTIYGTTDPAARLQWETADNLAWEYYFGEDGKGATDAKSPALTVALKKISAAVVQSALPLHATLKNAAAVAALTPVPMLIVASRSRRGAESHAAELVQYLKEAIVQEKGLGIAGSSEVRKTLGDIGSAVVVSGVAGAVLIVQAGTGTKRKMESV